MLSFATLLSFFLTASLALSIGNQKLTWKDRNMMLWSQYDWGRAHPDTNILYNQYWRLLKKQNKTNYMCLQLAIWIHHRYMLVHLLFPLVYIHLYTGWIFLQAKSCFLMVLAVVLPLCFKPKIYHLLLCWSTTEHPFQQQRGCSQMPNICCLDCRSTLCAGGAFHMFVKTKFLLWRALRLRGIFLPAHSHLGIPMSCLMHMCWRTEQNNFMV